MKSLAFLLTFSLFFAGCGYKPQAKFARAVVGGKVSVSLEVLAADPENAVIAKDAILKALISRFKVVTTSREFSVTHLHVALGGISESVLEYDANGYVIAKRMSVSLVVQRTTKGKTTSYSVSGQYDFNIEPNAVVSDTDRFKAIRYGSLKAVDAFIAQLAVQGE